MILPASSHPLAIIASLIHLLSLLVLVDVIVSWAWLLGMRGASPYQPWVRLLRRITDPILAPIRRLIPPRSLQGLDISPIIAILLLQLVADALASVAHGM
ncbi:MAG: YggT family protein [Chthonomonadales bacterium]|nr:YggT family protein [Chthonomonadales bacterium]